MARRKPDNGRARVAGGSSTSRTVAHPRTQGTGVHSLSQRLYDSSRLLVVANTGRASGRQARQPVGRCQPIEHCGGSTVLDAVRCGQGDSIEFNRVVEESQQIVAVRFGQIQDAIIQNRFYRVTSTQPCGRWASVRGDEWATCCVCPFPNQSGILRHPY